jgi:hypothetical protein
MVAYASYTAQEFLETPDDIIFARLVQSDAVSGFSQFSHKQLSFGLQYCPPKPGDRRPKLTPYSRDGHGAKPFDS